MNHSIESAEVAPPPAKPELSESAEVAPPVPKPELIELTEIAPLAKHLLMESVEVAPPAAKPELIESVEVAPPAKPHSIELGEVAPPANPHVIESSGVAPPPAKSRSRSSCGGTFESDNARRLPLNSLPLPPSLDLKHTNHNEYYNMTNYCTRRVKCKL